MMKTNDWLPSSPNQIGGVRTRLITPLHVAKNVSLKVLIDSNYSLIYDLSSSTPLHLAASSLSTWSF